MIYIYIYIHTHINTSLYIIVIMIVIHILHAMKRYKIQNSIYKIVVYNSDTFKLDIMSNDLLTI